MAGWHVVTALRQTASAAWWLTCSGVLPQEHNGTAQSVHHACSVQLQCRWLTVQVSHGPFVSGNHRMLLAYTLQHFQCRTAVCRLAADVSMQDMPRQASTTFDDDRSCGSPHQSTTASKPASAPTGHNDVSPRALSHSQWWPGPWELSPQRGSAQGGPASAPAPGIREGSSLDLNNVLQTGRSTTNSPSASDNTRWGWHF